MKVNDIFGYSRARTWNTYATLGFSCMLENGWLVGGLSTGSTSCNGLNILLEREEEAG